MACVDGLWGEAEIALETVRGLIRRAWSNTTYSSGHNRARGALLRQNRSDSDQRRFRAYAIRVGNLN